jgi:hypothetical protein
MLPPNVIHVVCELPWHLVTELVNTYGVLHLHHRLIFLRFRLRFQFLPGEAAPKEVQQDVSKALIRLRKCS